MNFLGMGPLEIVVIAVLAFIVLGPERMVDAGRMLGRAAREVKRLTDEMPKFSLDDVEGPSDSAAGQGAEGRTTRAGEPDGEGPVSFRRSRPETKGKPPGRDEQGGDKA